ncbi:hypothetical protein ABZZ36_38760 [Actinacidiphila glaucinigra]|uniref:hypothetical protein n=1 Tax=Actinacidiphila glaucinigra TaxID=235986 RepID=UPI0033A27823
MDELMPRRVYGTDVDDPRPGPRPGCVSRELCGGLLDGLFLDVTGWTKTERASGALLRTDIGRFGSGGRRVYGPRPADPVRWGWQGDTR